MRLKNKCEMIRPKLLPDSEERAKGMLVHELADKVRRSLLDNIEAYKVENHPSGNDVYEVDYVIMKHTDAVKLYKTFDGILDILGVSKKERKFIEDYFVEITSKEI